MSVTPPRPASLDYLGSSITEIRAVEFAASFTNSALPRLRSRFGMGTSLVEQTHARPVATKLLYANAYEEAWMMLFRLSDELWRLRIFAPGPAEMWAAPELKPLLDEWDALAADVISELGGVVETRFDYFSQMEVA